MKTHSVNVALRLVLLLLVISVFNNCSYLNRDKNLAVIVQLERENLVLSSLLVFNFKEPAHAEGMGAHVAELFHLELLKAKKFKVASLYTDSTWDRIADTEENRLLEAIAQAKERQFEYILVGDLRQFFYGGMTKSEVNMKVRLIEVHTRTTIFMATYNMEKLGKDPSYPMQTKLSKVSPHPKALAAKIVRQMVKKL